MFARRIGRVALAAAMAVGLGLAASPARGHAETRAAVPWAQVGPGWALALYTQSTIGQYDQVGRPGPATLYLISPSGKKYALVTLPLPDSAHVVSLDDWSGDKTGALIELNNGTIEQVTLTTGQISQFRLPGIATPVGYTRRGGQQLLGTLLTSSGTSYNLYTLTGKLVKALGAGPTSASPPVYSPDGTLLATQGSHGLQLISGEGGVVRQLAPTGSGCWPAGWLDAGTVLASCPGSSQVTHLWFVPVSGGPATELPAPRGLTGPDNGVVGVYRLPTGTYLQVTGRNSGLEIARERADGSAVWVPVPGAAGLSCDVVGAAGSRLLLQVLGRNGSSSSLMWFNPATGAEQWLLRPPANELGVLFSPIEYHS